MSIKAMRFFFVIPLFVFSFISVVHAQSTPVVQGAGTLVASVNIQGVSIVAQEGNTFTLKFNLTNGAGVQSGVLYRVQLMSKAEKGQVAVDEKVYDDTVFLPENTVVEKTITYTAPTALTGTYTLYIDAKNEKGFPFGINSFGEVTLQGSTGGVSVNPDSCSIAVGMQKYTLNGPQGILVNPADTLALTCTLTNASDTSLSVTPSFETNVKSSFGKSIDTTGNTDAIAFAAKESKPVTITFTAPTAPSLYVTRMSLLSADGTHGSVELRYAVRGTIGTIENLSLSKESFVQGEEAKLAIIWSAYSDNINKQSTDITLTATIKDSAGRTCAAPSSQTLPMQRTTPTTDFTFPITRDCASPVVSVTLTDNEGVVLDTQTLGFSVDDHSGVGSEMKKLILVVLISLVGIAVVWFYVRWLKKQQTTFPQ